MLNIECQYYNLNALIMQIMAFQHLATFNLIIGELLIECKHDLANNREWADGIIKTKFEDPMPSEDLKDPFLR